MTEAVPVFTTPGPRIREVPVDRAWTWLAAGWNDLIRAPVVSLSYGAILVGVSFALSLGLWLVNLFYLVLPLAAGFMFVAPLLAIGLYETSRRLGLGLPVTLADVLAAGRSNRGQIATMGLVLMLFNLAWVRLATLLFALFFPGANPSLEGLPDLIISTKGMPFLIVGTAIGAALAALVFSISVVALPLLMDRDVNVFTAIATSLTAVQINYKAMALWAVLIVVFTGFGLAAFYIGLAVTLPLVGHASWHAYKDIVE